MSAASGISHRELLRLRRSGRALYTLATMRTRSPAGLFTEQALARLLWRCCSRHLTHFAPEALLLLMTSSQQSKTVACLCFKHTMWLT